MHLFTMSKDPAVAVQKDGERPNLLSCATLFQVVALVEPDGIEPTTSCLQSTRSPN